MYTAQSSVTYEYLIRIARIGRNLNWHALEHRRVSLSLPVRSFCFRLPSPLMMTWSSLTSSSSSSSSSSSRFSPGLVTSSHRGGAILRGGGGGVDRPLHCPPSERPPPSSSSVVWDGKGGRPGGKKEGKGKKRKENRSYLFFPPKCQMCLRSNAANDRERGGEGERRTNGEARVTWLLDGVVSLVLTVQRRAVQIGWYIDFFLRKWRGGGQFAMVR